MEERSNNKDRITKTGEFSWETTKNLGSSKDINGKGKKAIKKQFDKKRQNPQGLK